MKSSAEPVTQRLRLPRASDGSASVATFIDERWRLEAQIGYGAFGSVHRARDKDTGDIVAVKIFDASLESNGYVQELGLLFSEEHPNVVRTLSFGYTSGQRYIVYEFMQGGSLRDFLIRSPRVEPEVALAVVRDVAAGIAFAHSHDVVHRDLKPENILLTRADPPYTAKLCDFGLSARGKPGEKMRARYGSPGYMAPEQFRGEYDHRVDFYALGVVLYEMLFGRRPFEGDVVTIRHAHEHQQVPIPSDLVPSLGALLRRALARAPGSRYQHADELLEDVANVQRALSMQHTASAVSQPVFHETVLEPAWSMELPVAVRHATMTTGGHLLLGSHSSISLCTRAGRYVDLVRLHQPVEELVDGSCVRGVVGWVSKGELWFFERGRIERSDGDGNLLAQARRVVLSPRGDEILVVTPSYVELRELGGRACWRAEISSYGMLPPACFSADGELVWLALESPRTQIVALTRAGERLLRASAPGSDPILLPSGARRVVVGSRGRRTLVTMSLEGFVEERLELVGPLIDAFSTGPRAAVALGATHRQFLELEPTTSRTILPHDMSPGLEFYGAEGVYRLELATEQAVLHYEALSKIPTE
ncbi:MAG: serine/threonine-protein kinase [Myxococcota bacterium]